MIQTLYTPFQHWSKKGSVYLVSDTHFNDSDRKLMEYGISETEQLYLINECCKKNDTLIHLGDVGDPEYIKKIKGYKVLLMGNHDSSASKMKEYFDEVYTGPLWIAEKLVISHEPLEITFGGTIPICFNIHGHDHSGLGYNDNCHLNIVQNLFGFFPLDLKQFINQGYLKKIESAHRATINKRIERNGIRL